ncbi:MAG: GNAT family N-acetyltransferase [bacterium]
MGPIEKLEQRRLTLNDCQNAVLLSHEAGWNQTIRDWEFMLVHGQGFGFGTAENPLVATALTLPHGSRMAWISMVLVTAACRKRGLATRLMQTCLDSLAERAIRPVLDATDTGRRVYGKIGFVPLYRLQRLIRQTDGHTQTESTPGPRFDIRPITRSDLQTIINLDQPIFGADRSAVLVHLHDRQPGSACFIHEESGTGQGFIMAREGTRAFHLGPVIAENTETAMALTAHVLGKISGPVTIDALDQHERYQSWLKDNGFETQRAFTRMTLKPGTAFDHPGRIYASAGPEFG